MLPGLVTLRGRRQEEVVARLRERLADLRAEGAVAFRFKDLIDPLKADVRARWAALLDQAAGEGAPERVGDEAVRTVRLVRPDTSFEERQLFRKLVACVLASIERLDVNEKTRAYLTDFWQFLRVNAASGLAEERLSQRRTAELLRIPRDRLDDLRETLGELFERCRGVNSGRLPGTALPGTFAPTGPGGITP